jgi:hypothetical protein
MPTWRTHPCKLSQEEIIRKLCCWRSRASWTGLRFYWRGMDVSSTNKRMPQMEESRTTFYRLLESGRWLRLRLTSSEAITSNAGAMTTVSLDPNANNGLFANCASVLVRPDGYLAHVCPEGDVQAV